MMDVVPSRSEKWKFPSVTKSAVDVKNVVFLFLFVVSLIMGRRPRV
jgi:hypothetical protein